MTVDHLGSRVLGGQHDDEIGIEDDRHLTAEAPVALLAALRNDLDHIDR